MFNECFKIDVGNYYFYDKDNNLIDCIKEMEKEIISYNSGKCGVSINLINASIHNKLIDNFEKVKRIVWQYQVYPRTSQKLYNDKSFEIVCETIEKFKLENFKIISKKDKASIMNIKLNIFDKTIITDNKNIVDDYIAMKVKDALNDLTDNWNELNNSTKETITQSIAGIRYKNIIKSYLDNISNK